MPAQHTREEVDTRRRTKVSYLGGRTTSWPPTIPNISAFIPCIFAKRPNTFSAGTNDEHLVPFGDYGFMGYSSAWKITNAGALAASAQHGGQLFRIQFLAKFKEHKGVPKQHPACEVP